MGQLVSRSVSHKTAQSLIIRAFLLWIWGWRCDGVDVPCDKIVTIWPFKVILWTLEVNIFSRLLLSFKFSQTFLFDRVGRCEGADVQSGQILTLWPFKVILWPLHFKCCLGFYSAANSHSLFMLMWEEDVMEWNFDHMTFQGHLVTFRIQMLSRLLLCPYLSEPFH